MELTKAKPDKSMTGELQRHTGGKHFKQFESTEEAYKFGQELAEAHQQATNRSCLWVDKTIFLENDMLGFILTIYSDQGNWDTVRRISPALIAAVRDDPSLAPAHIESLIVADELNNTTRMSHVTPLQEVEDSIFLSPKQPVPDASPTRAAATRTISKTTPFTPPAKNVPQLATTKMKSIPVDIDQASPQTPAATAGPQSKKSKKMPVLKLEEVQKLVHAKISEASSKSRKAVFWN